MDSLSLIRQDALRAANNTNTVQHTAVFCRFVSFCFSSHPRACDLKKNSNDVGYKKFDGYKGVSVMLVIIVIY